MNYFQASVVQSLFDRPFAGSFPITLTPAARHHFSFEGLTDDPLVHFVNSEYVVQASAQIIVFGSRQPFPTTAMDYRDQWFRVQFHPEMAHDVITVEFKFTMPRLLEHFHPLTAATKLLYNFLTGTSMLN